MSLLLDALKRAEQEKLMRSPDRTQDRTHERASERPAERPQSPDPSAPPRPDRRAAALELQPLGSAPAAAARNDAHAAQMVFQAKAANSESRGRGMLWAVVGVIAVLVVAAGAYVWYSVQMLTPQEPPALGRPRPPSAPTPPPAQAGMPEMPPMVLAEPPPRGATAGGPAAPAKAPAPDEDLVARILREAPAARAAEPLKLARTTETPRVPAALASGYEALRRGDLDAARRGYQEALAADASSLDAQLGMATVEARAGNAPAAAAHYRRALDLDPRNATALAGMATLAESARPEAVEQQLRQDLAGNPGSAALHFALGSLFASQSRWNEAQAEFFEAHRVDPAAPEILFNLAVSLDHLGQARLAADFYRRTVQAARGRAVPFDPGPAERRLAELTR